MARIDAAYDYFLTTYGQNIGSRYESHKKSELRETYNSIVKANKESPLYKIAQTESLGQFAIDIKEHANDMAVAISGLTAGGDDISAILSKRVAASSDEEAVSATYIGDGNSDAPGFEIEVKALATPQVNQGNFLDPSMRSFEEGQYSFDLDTRTNSYEFQFNVNPMDNNLDVQSKVMRLINTADVGLSAEIIEDNHGYTALSVSSKATGVSADEDYIFRIQSGTSWRELNTLGIGKMTSAPANSSFVLNGNEHESISNSFTVNNSYEITLHYPTNSTVKIGLMTDTEALSIGVDTLLRAYNGMLDVGLKYSESNANNTLLNEISKAAKGMQSSLTSIGINSDEQGHLSLDRLTLSEKTNSPQKQETLDILNNFKNALMRQSKKASINPMNYVDKVVVEYKNPNNTLAHPYASSQYSGMLVDYGL